MCRGLGPHPPTIPSQLPANHRSPPSAPPACHRHQPATATAHRPPARCLQSLVDDHLVHGEKIGISNYFWAFPSEAAVILDGQVAAAEATLRVGLGLKAGRGPVGMGNGEMTAWRRGGVRGAGVCLDFREAELALPWFCRLLQDKRAERAALQKKAEQSRAGKDDSVRGCHALRCPPACPPFLQHPPSLNSAACQAEALLRPARYRPPRLPRAWVQDERQQLAAQLAALQAEVAAQREELAEYAGNDPDRYDALSECGVQHTEGRRWGVRSRVVLTWQCRLCACVVRSLPLYTCCCPSRCRAAEEAAKLACDSANRWVDNIDALRVGSGVGGLLAMARQLAATSCGWWCA